MVGMTASHRSRTAALALAAALIAGLAGCNSDPEPTSSTSTSTSTTSSTTTPSSSTSTSPSSTSAYVPVKPEMPAEAKKQTDDGAIAFTEYYWHALDYALAKPDVDILSSLSTKDCSACTAMRNFTESLISKSEYYDAPTLALKESEFVYNADGVASVLCRLDFLKVRIRDSRGNVVDTIDPESVVRVLTLRWAGSWQVTTIADG